MNSPCRMTLKGWLAAFIVGAARETEARTGSRFALSILDMVTEYSPVLALDWNIAELLAQVSALMAHLSRKPS